MLFNVSAYLTGAAAVFRSWFGLPDLAGILLGLGAAALYAGVVITNKKTAGVEADQRTIVQLLSAGAVMVPYLCLTGGFSGLTWTPSAVILLLVVGIVHTGAAYALYFGSMEGLRVQSIAVLSYIDPVEAVLLSAFFLKEPISVFTVIGAVMILGATAFSELTPDSSRQ